VKILKKMDEKADKEAMLNNFNNDAEKNSNS
jgi:hypothetical protein